MTLLWVVLLLVAAGPAPAAGGTVGDLPCVLCHPSRDKAVFELLSRDPAVLLGSESAQAFVCLSCHNGTAADDRAALYRGAQHPAGIRVDRSIPEPFRRYPGNRLECGSCHSPHGQAGPPAAWLRKAPEGNEPCRSCHADVSRDGHLGRALPERAARSVRDRGGRTGAGNVVVCATCHRAHGGTGAALLLAPYGPDRDDLCRLCHDALEVKGRTAGDGLPCAACHRPHTDTPLMARPRGPCRSCHPQPPDGTEHPAASPLCSDCHSVHHPVKPGGAPRGLLRLPATGGLLCAPCHPDAGAPHGPGIRAPEAPADLLAARGIRLGTGGAADCTACHRVHGARNAPLLGTPNGVLCLYCHPDQNPFGPDGPRPGVHPVGVRTADEPPITCATCHRAHRADAPAPARCSRCHPDQNGGEGHGDEPGCAACHEVHGRLPAAARCAGCHTEIVPGHPAAAVSPGAGLPGFDRDGAPSPWGAVGCPTCHAPHMPRDRVGPALRASSPAALCLGCHPGKKAVLASAHRPREGDDPCLGCHPPHPDAPPPNGGDPASARCRECHANDRQSLPAHTADGPPPWKGLDDRLPLFDRFGARNPYGFMACPTCHDVHEPGGFRLEPRDPPRLCLTCHGDKASLLGSEHDPRRERKGAPACSRCHPMHTGEDSPRPGSLVWKDATGTWNDRKCTGCHGGRTGRADHPVNRPVPEAMRSGGLPLFDPLGGPYGRVVACSTCHDVHGTWGADGELLPAFLRRPPGDGTLCTACHAGAAAVAGTPHDLRATEPGPLGPCSPCHAAHGATLPYGLWGLEPAPGPYVPNRLCRSCHDGEHRGRPLLQYHMKDADPLRTPRGTIYLQRPLLLTDELALRRGTPPVIRLYDRAGTAGTDGNLQCVSCHDPHQWSPLGPFLKPGFGTVGPNVPTRFLRLKAPGDAGASVCSTCHPDDAVRRYEEYHRVWSDVGAQFQ